MADFFVVSPGGPTKKNANKEQQHPQQYTSVLVLQPTTRFFRFQTRREVLLLFFQVGGIIDLVLDFAAPQDGDCCGCSDKQGIEKWRITHSKYGACDACKDGGYLHQDKKCIGASQNYCDTYWCCYHEDDIKDGCDSGGDFTDEECFICDELVEQREVFDGYMTPLREHFPSVVAELITEYCTPPVGTFKDGFLSVKW